MKEITFALMHDWFEGAFVEPLKITFASSPLFFMVFTYFLTFPVALVKVTPVHDKRVQDFRYVYKVEFKTKIKLRKKGNDFIYNTNGRFKNLEMSFYKCSSSNFLSKIVIYFWENCKFKFALLILSRKKLN